MSLVEVRISNLAVFDEAVVTLGEGFTALTGETGSGKSVWVTAVRLALGERAEGDPVRAGAAAARVTAVFDEAPAALLQRLAEVGLPDDELVTLSREVSRSGRGSCRVNGGLVSLAVLREVGEALAEVTLQGASHRLLQRGRQRDLLDLAAGAAELRDEVRVAVAAWRSAEGSLDELRRRQAAGVVELEAARGVVADLRSLDLRPGEDDQLAGERLLLRNAHTLAAAATTLRAATGGDDDSPGAADVLAGALEPLAGVEGVDPALDTLAAETTDLVDRLRDLGAAARRHAESIVVDEVRLAQVEERLDLLARVRRRHGSVEQALETLATAEDLLAAGTEGGPRLAAAEAAVTASRDHAGELAARLSERRHQAGRRLQEAVEAALHRLELPHARLLVAFERRADPGGVEVDGATVRCGPTGIDEVELRLATNRGAPPAPLDAGPSGGELSRLVLALSACIAETGSPLLLLDEVDTGIGGETAARVGDLLAATGRRRQVVAVTHRAEIASRADRQLVVRKSETARGTVAAVAEADGEDRLEEIARLMSGRVTGAALRRAVELRGEAVQSAGRPGGQRRPRVARR